MQGGCIIRAGFLDEIKQAYERDPGLKNLLVDQEFGQKIAERQVCIGRPTCSRASCAHGVSVHTLGPLSHNHVC